MGLGANIFRCDDSIQSQTHLTVPYTFVCPHFHAPVGFECSHELRVAQCDIP
jgi:hypothetical protein